MRDAYNASSVSEAATIRNSEPLTGFRFRHTWRYSDFACPPPVCAFVRHSRGPGGMGGIGICPRTPGDGHTSRASGRPLRQEESHDVRVSADNRVISRSRYSCQLCLAHLRTYCGRHRLRAVHDCGDNLGCADKCWQLEGSVYVALYRACIRGHRFRAYCRWLCRCPFRP